MAVSFKLSCYSKRAKEEEENNCSRTILSSQFKASIPLDSSISGTFCEILLFFFFFFVFCFFAFSSLSSREQNNLFPFSVMRCCYCSLPAGLEERKRTVKN
jgi:hypothetical protein